VNKSPVSPPAERLFFVAVIMAVLFFPACVRARVHPAPGPSGYETGIASWYGPDFHGRPTSNREIYDMYDMTAAHPTLPFGTRIMVTNLENGRAAEVRINDRGPFVKNRIIDLSYAAARMLGMIGTGTAPVRLDILSGNAKPARPGYVIQLGSFTDENNARDLKKGLGDRYGTAFISEYALAGRTFYRVRILAGERPETEALAARLCADGYPVLICEINYP